MENKAMKKKGKLWLVSVGPGKAELIAPAAREAIRQSEVVVSYPLYMRWIEPWLEGREIISTGMTQEKARAQQAMDRAREGKVVSLLSSGDIGVYAMAPVVLEMMGEDEPFDVEVVPGVSSANAAAALLGAPLSHDFATLSLSDLLCPWEWIEERARRLAQADMVVALYNVQSKQRREGVYRVLSVFLEYKRGETLCGVVRNAYREEQEVSVHTLDELMRREFDMLTTVVVGNRFTRMKGPHLYTPRGYGAWDGEVAPEFQSDKGDRPVWVFSGTGDGNALAGTLAEAGLSVVISAATQYGADLAGRACPGVRVRAGRMGAEARRRELQRTGASAVVDATHPYAVGMSRQLMEMCQELGLAYFRYERPSLPLPEEALVARDVEEAVKLVVEHGTKIFVATGVKELGRFLRTEGAEKREWFARVSPDAANVEQALACGMAPKNLVAMQGPFSREVNEAMMREWGVDCVVTKESGHAGGFAAKVEAAQAVGAVLVVLKRPAVFYPNCFTDFESLTDGVRQKVC